MCTDGAPVNVKMYKLIKRELGDHYLLTLCPAHKIELAIKDAFEESGLNNDCNNDYTNIYYLFKKANLRWRLFKQQSMFEGIEYIKYKRPSGTRWVEHQITALNSHLKNLPIFIGFCNNQILHPHNPQIKKIKSKLQGFKDDVCETKKLLFETIKYDILGILIPLSKTLQESSLLLPKLMSVSRKVLRSFEKLSILLDRDGGEIFHRDDIFPTASEMLEQLTDEDHDIVPDRQTRADAAANPNNKFTTYHGYLLKGNVVDAIESCHFEFTNILGTLREAIVKRMEPLLESVVFRSISMILDSGSYQFHERDTIYDEVNVVVDHFKPLLVANGCNIDHLREEFEVLHDHIQRYVSKSTPEKCWPNIFKIGRDLGICNLLHVIEICLVVPLSNAESERVFSFLWRIFSKERQSLKHETLEMLLHVRSDNDLSVERYADPVAMFMNEFPDGTIRKHKRHLQGHQYPTNRKSTKQDNRDVAAVLDEILPDDDDPMIIPPLDPQDLPLEEISDDEWTDESSDED